MGGVKLYRDENVVVSRPAADKYAAFSTICTHAGCPISMLGGHRTHVLLPRQPVRRRDRQGAARPGEQPLAKVPVVVKNGKIVAGPEALPDPDRRMRPSPS